MAAHIIRARVTRTLTLGIAAAIGLVGCGGSGGGGKPVTVPAGKPVAVKAQEYSFDPKTIQVSAGKVRFELTNAGVQAHDLHVERDGQDLGGTPIFSGGQSAGATLNLKPGTYDFVCTVGDHEQLGMKGKLVVK
jgi:plastocyanin